MFRIHMHKHASEREAKKNQFFRNVLMLVNINFLNVEHKNQAEQTLDNESLAVG